MTAARGAAPDHDTIPVSAALAAHVRAASRRPRLSRSPRRPAPGRRAPVAPGILWLRMPLPFALDHINLWLLADDDGLDARRLRLRRRRDARAVGAALRDDAAAAGRSRGSSPRTATPTTSATPPGSRSASAAPVTMTHGEFLTAHAIVDERAAHALADTCALFRRARHGRGATSTRCARAATRTGAACPSARAASTRLLAGDRRRRRHARGG